MGSTIIERISIPRSDGGVDSEFSLEPSAEISVDENHKVWCPWENNYGPLK